MASILGAVIVKSMAGRIGDVIAGSLASKAKASSPIPVPAASAVTQAVVEAIGKSEEIAVVPVKPMAKSAVTWTMLGGALVVLLNQLAPTIGLTISQPISDAVETITSFLGLPPGTGRFIVAAGTLAAFLVALVWKKWFNHSITPAAADRAFEKGKVV